MSHQSRVVRGGNSPTLAVLRSTGHLTYGDTDAELEAELGNT